MTKARKYEGAYAVCSATADAPRILFEACMEWDRAMETLDNKVERYYERKFGMTPEEPFVPSPSVVGVEEYRGVASDKTLRLYHWSEEPAAEIDLARGVVEFWMPYEDERRTVAKILEGIGLECREAGGERVTCTGVTPENVKKVARALALIVTEIPSETLEEDFGGTENFIHLVREWLNL